MPRGDAQQQTLVTQERKFNYGTPPGLNLLSAESPENGTVSYTYFAGGLLATKTDAKGHHVRYGYDSAKRLTLVQYYPTVNANEDTWARVEISYDTNPYDANYSEYALGRMTARKYTVNGRLFTEMYGYTAAGLPNKKRLRISQTFEESYPPSVVSQDLEASWEYDNEGKMVSVTYPSAMVGVPPYVQQGNGATYTTAYDAMGRPVSMGSLVTNATYGPAGELLTMTGVVNETRSYNSRLQLTAWNGTSYTYGTDQNNGRMQSETASGETVTYQYDELNRLSKAETVSPSWGQQFTYDGFGSLTQKAVTRGSAPALSVLVDRATNRISGYSYDANGNQLTTNTQDLTYDYENRVSTADNRNLTIEAYGYDPDNRRVYAGTSVWDWMTGWSYSKETVYFYGVGGERLGSYRVYADKGVWPGYQASMILVLDGERVYFGGKLIQIGEKNANGQYVVTNVQQDRLGTVGSYYPYGEERGSGGSMFATCSRDAGGLDYAMNRYYSSGLGRFVTPDPFGGSARAGDPGSWNRYGYVGGDPVNGNDPEGLCDVAIAGVRMEAGKSGKFDSVFSDEITAYPYSGSFPTGLAQLLFGKADVEVAYQAIMRAAQSPGDINVTTISGGSAAFAAAYARLSKELKARIHNITYLLPGNIAGELPKGTGQTTLVLGKWSDYFLPSGPVLPGERTKIIESDCGHDPDCVLKEQASLLASVAGTPCDSPERITRTSVAADVYGFDGRTFAAVRPSYYDVFYFMSLATRDLTPSVTSRILPF